MNAPPDKIARRRRKPLPRRTPAIMEQRERKPLIFGWGADLNRQQREAVKERIALFGGIALAVLLVAIIGWGWYQDTIARPAAVARENNTPIAQVGSFTIRTGFFKAFEKFQKNQLDQQVTQGQQQLASLQANAKKNAAQISQLESQLGILQQQQGSIASSSLSLLIDEQVVLQRSWTAGIKLTPKLQKQVMDAQIKSAGGRLHFQNFVKQSGMTEDQIKMLVTADAIRLKLEKKVTAGVSHYQTKVRASHILIPAKKKALAERLYQDVLHGANFAALAKKYSTDTASAKVGGDLGYFAQGTMVPQFDKAAFSMKIGQIRLVKSQYGWHIIKVTGHQRHTMTASEFQQAQASAFQTWLNKQQAVLHVQHFVATQNLPGAQAQPTTSPLTNLPQSPAQPATGQNPAVPNSQAPSTGNSQLPSTLQNQPKKSKSKPKK